MKNFGPQGRKVALTLHLVCCATWFGAATAMMTLIISSGQTNKPGDALAATWRAIKTIDDGVIIASAGASFVTGCVLSLGTNWGFIKWYWILVKLVTTAVLIAFGASCLGPWINAATALVTQHGQEAMDMENFNDLYFRIRLLGTGQVFVLALIFGVSVFKPWGKTRAGNQGKRPARKTYRHSRVEVS